MADKEFALLLDTVKKEYIPPPIIPSPVIIDNDTNSYLSMDTSNDKE